MTKALAFASVSSIAIETSISQPRRSADIIPFPVAQDDAPLGEPAANDNAAEVPAPLAPASAVIDRAALTKAVEIVDRAVERRNSIPILSNIRMTAHDGLLAISGTDLDVDITVTVPGAVDGHFATTLPAKIIKDLLKKATASDFVAITNEDGFDTLDFERVDYRLNSLPVADFPDLNPPALGACAFTMPGNEFWDGLDCTMGAISTEETRYYLNGIFLHVYEYGARPQLRMVATDGHKLYRRDFEVPVGCADMPAVIIPRKTVALLHALMKGKACPTTVRIEASSTRLRFSFGDVVVTSKTIDGTFPDYMRVIPQYNDKIAGFDTANLSEAIRAVTLISSERGRSVKFAIEDGKATLSAANAEMGSSKSEVACEYQCDPVEIGFDANYLDDILSIVGSRVSFAVADTGGPALITGQRAGFTCVLMPRRV